MTDNTEDRVTTWHYEPRFDAEDKLWYVAEVYPGLGETDAIRPSGDTLDDLIEGLEVILTDLNECRAELDDDPDAALEQAFDDGWLAGWEAATSSLDLPQLGRSISSASRGKR